MRFEVLTLFPEFIEEGLNISITGRALREGIISLEAVNIRDFTLDAHGRVDDYPYGGGAGMLIKAQPVFDAWNYAVSALRESDNKDKEVCAKKYRTIYLTPSGEPFTQKMAEELAGENELIFLCGHYEGIDERVLDEIVTDRVSIGDYVLTGGELPALVMMDAISRLVPGVLHNDESADSESFHNDLLEYPQYSRPETWRGKSVPGVLLSGNHADVEKWRLNRSRDLTGRVRPDLYEKYCEKQSVIGMLSRKKRENIHMIECLCAGSGDILYHEGENVLVYDRRGHVCMASVPDEECGGMIVSLIPDDADEIVVNQSYLADMILNETGTVICGEYRQACYTRKVPLKVQCRNLRTLDPAEEALARDLVRNEAGNEYLEQIPAKIRLIGAYAGEKLTGFIGLLPDGSMGMLYVREEYRRNHIALSLESFLINRLLEQGRTPYTRVDPENESCLSLQNRLGLYLSDGCVWCLKKKRD